MSQPPDDRPKGRREIYTEDALILLSVVLLFVLTVFFRHTLGGQIGLVALLVVMAVVFWRRLRRTHKAFRDQEE